MISDKDKLHLIREIAEQSAICGMDTADELRAVISCIEVIANFEGGSKDD